MPDLITLSRRSFCVMPLALAACKRGPEVFSLTGLTMGTGYSVVAIDNDRQLDETQIRRAIDTALAEVNSQMSNWDATSEISQFNASGTALVTMSPGLGEVMHAAEAVQQASAGRFDTTMGPLIELWGFGAPGGRGAPTDEQIELALERSGHEQTLRVGAESLQKQRGDAQVYLAGIGKGYGADRVGRALSALGISDYLVEIGGDLVTAGLNPDGMQWQVGIETPVAMGGGVYGVVGVSGMGLASSGDYRNFYERDGARFTHLIDPTTGRPITHATGSATVIAENSMLADAWSTAMLTLGRERGLEIAEREGVAVVFIDRDGDSAAPRFRATSSSHYDSIAA